jgi:hypothetical protein
MRAAQPLSMVPLPPPTVPLGTTPPTAEDFCDWLHNAMPGQCFEYHQGLLACDREAEMNKPRTEDQLRIDLLAICVLSYAAHRMVHLLQRRLDDQRCSYLAVRSTPRRRA